MTADAPPIRIVLWGASGRMGEALLSVLGEWHGIALAAAIVSPHSPWRGRKLSERVPSAPSALRFLGGEECPPCDAIVEFSGRAGLEAAVAAAERLGSALVSGSTGLGPEEEGRLREASARVPVLWAANFSPGATVLALLAERAAAWLPDFDAELLEIHHRGKRDAPSGTARTLAEALRRGAQHSGRGTKAVFHRPGPRGADEIGLVSLRGGDAVGEHRLLLLGEGERLELVHQASDRRVFARGALKAAAWLAHKPPRLYRLEEVFSPPEGASGWTGSAPGL